ncbi:MAG: FkbM family methyltransferase [Candidatus Acidiferrum sp.]|jgi:FkbM family methyltransferase
MNVIEIVARRVKRSLKLADDSRFVCAIRPAYSSMLERFYGRKGLSRTIHGEQPIRLLPSARQIPEEYEPQVLDLLKQTITPGAVVLDVGANVGVSAMMMARWCGPEGHIYAFEPSPNPKQLLTEHLRMNGLSDRVTVCPTALSDAEGTTTFFASGISGKSALSGVNIGQSSEQVQVPVTTIDAYCQSKNIKPSLIKIDVEGFEFNVLNGARNTLKKFRPSILVELHPMNWPALGIDVGWAAEQLRGLNYIATAVEKQADVMSEHGHIMLHPIEGVF